MINQSSIRHQMLKMRAELSQDYIDTHLDSFNQKLISFVQQFSSIAIYSAIRNEVPLDRIVEHYSASKKLSLPKINANDELEFVGYQPKHLWKIGKYDIPEPITDVIAYIPDVFIVPLTAVDKLGTRIGMGKGYYDRYLKNIKDQSILVGVGWDFQLHNENFHRQSHDIPMDCFISPSACIKFRQ